MVGAWADLGTGYALLVEPYRKIAQVTASASTWTRASRTIEALKLVVGELLQSVATRFQRDPLTIVCLQL